MTVRSAAVLALGLLLASCGVGAGEPPVSDQPAPGTPPMRRVQKTDEEWKRELTPEQYRVMRGKGTERAFTGKYWDTTTTGVYHCAACGTALFESDTKFESGCGWPSFFRPLEGWRVEEHEDRSFGMVRREVVCATCGAHLGHVFDDGPPPTGLRYCINSVSLELKEGEGSTPADGGR